ncbi:MAG: hypothetical protein WBB84_02480, partial [Candidatus Omnitrophota bacterium]
EEPAVVRIDYEKDRVEQIFYAGFDMLKKRVKEINEKGPINLIMPSEMFAEGGVNMPGSRDWWQKMFREYVNPQISIGLYRSKSRKKEKTGLDAAADAFDSKATNILVATESKLGSASSEQQGFISKVRIMAVPDVDEARELRTDAGNLGWFFARETIGASLLLSIVEPDNIFFDKGVETSASDLQRFMGQALNRQVDRTDLCYMLSYDEVQGALSRAEERWKDAKWFQEIRDAFSSGITAWLAALVKRALLDMPIEPYNTNEHLRERQENMFKAIRAV